MYQITQCEIQKVMAAAMAKGLGQSNVSADSIIVETQYPNQFYKITVRLNSLFKVLPTPEQVKKKYQQTGIQGEGAKWLMFGAIQVVGNQLRVTTRIVKTETSEINRASLGDGENSYEGLNKAFEKAILGLNIVFVA